MVDPPLSSRLGFTGPGAAGPAVALTGLGPLLPVGATAPPAPSQSDGTGPGGAGRGPYFLGAPAPRFASQAAAKPAISMPNPCLNASASVRPSLYERMTATSWS